MSGYILHTPNQSTSFQKSCFRTRRLPQSIPVSCFSCVRCRLSVWCMRFYSPRNSANHSAILLTSLALRRVPPFCQKQVGYNNCCNRRYRTASLIPAVSPLAFAILHSLPPPKPLRCLALSYTQPILLSRRPLPPLPILPPPQQD